MFKLMKRSGSIALVTHYIMAVFGFLWTHSCAAMEWVLVSGDVTWSIITETTSAQRPSRSKMMHCALLFWIIVQHGYIFHNRVVRDDIFFVVSTSSSIVLMSMGFLKGFLSEIRSMVNKSSIYFHYLFYDIKYIIDPLLWFFFFFKLLFVL